MQEPKNIKQVLLEKYQDTIITGDLIELYYLIQEFGINHIKRVYPKNLFTEYFHLLNGAGVMENNNGNNNSHKINDELQSLNTFNIDWLRYFVIFAELGNSTEAAKHLNISPQALFKAITGIESHFKVTLIERGKHFKGLTLKGELFLEKARKILQDLHDLDNYVKDLRVDPLNNIVKIANTDLNNFSLMSEVIVNYTKKFPEAYPIFYSMTIKNIEKWVSSGEIDIGLIGRKPKRDDLDFIELKKSPYILVSKPQAKKHYTELVYILPRYFKTKDDIGFTTFFNTKFDPKGVCKTISGTESLLFALNLCEKGLGTVWVPEFAVIDRLKAGSLAIVADPPFEYYATPFIIWNNKIHKRHFVYEFINELKRLL